MALASAVCYGRGYPVFCRWDDLKDTQSSVLFSLQIIWKIDSR